MLFEFGKHPPIPLDPAPPIYDLLMMALDLPESGYHPDDGPKETIAQVSYCRRSLTFNKAIVDELISKSAMLNEYFSIGIDSKGCLYSIPVLLENYVPPLDGLPMFVLMLATRVNYTEEKACFQTVATELAEFYAIRPPKTLLPPPVVKQSAHTEPLMKTVIFEYG